MARIDPVPPEKMTPAQRRLYDKVMAQRPGSKASGPFAVLMHAPEIGELVTAFVDHLMSDTRVPHTLKEIAILSIARRYTAQYEWVVHEVRARRAGVADGAIEAMRHGGRPDFQDPNEALVYDMANEIVESRSLSDDRYARAVAALGEPAVVELVALIGFYIAIAVLLVAYRVEPPVREGAAPMPE